MLTVSGLISQTLKGHVWERAHTFEDYVERISVPFVRTLSQDDSWMFSLADYRFYEKIRFEYRPNRNEIVEDEIEEEIEDFYEDEDESEVVEISDMEKLEELIRLSREISK